MKIQESLRTFSEGEKHIIHELSWFHSYGNRRK
jgi:hypothetical protein